MYISDLVIWLFTILLQGKSLYPYNVGSPEMIRIGELARLVAKLGGRSTRVSIMKDGDTDGPVDSYLPDVTRASEKLGLKCLTTLPDSITKTIAYERARQQSLSGNNDFA
jgi:dTDP-glucose 4,6-dehydratase